MSLSVMPTRMDLNRDLLKDLDFIEKVQHLKESGRLDLMREYWSISESGWIAAIRRAVVAEEKLRRLTEGNVKNLVVWWIDRLARETLGTSLPLVIPDYVREQYAKLYKAKPEGRLFAAPEFGDVAVVEWPDTELAKHIAKNCNGIVVRKDSRMVGSHLPGIITTLSIEAAQF